MSLSGPVCSTPLNRLPSDAGRQYGTRVLVGLTCATFIPTVVAVLNFDILGESSRAFVSTFSLVTILGGAHVWLTLSYYLDASWRRYFLTVPNRFVFVPLAIIGVVTLMVTQPNRDIGLLAVYGATLINLWHHAKQNWGVLSIVAQARGTTVKPLRVPLVYAWPFFVPGWLLLLPQYSEMIGTGFLRWVAWVALGSYIVFASWHVARSWNRISHDAWTLTVALALLVYFVPILVLAGKPYGLLVWAGAHALQYYLVVFLSLSQRDRTPRWERHAVVPVATALASMVIVTLLAHEMAESVAGDFWDSPASRVLVGVLTGVNLVHFWVDRFIWRFSDSRVRDLHRAAFQF